MKKRIENGKIKITHQLTFESGENHNIKMLGKNSLYVFYVKENEKDILISPIEGTIKIIKIIKK